MLIAGRVEFPHEEVAILFLAMVVAAAFGHEEALEECPPPGVEGANGLIRTFHSDGLTWSYELTPELTPTEAVIEGALTWEYVGQYHYSVEPLPVVAQYVLDEELDTRSVVEELLDQYKVDFYGRRWEVTAVDEGLLEAERAEYFQESGEDNVLFQDLNAPRSDDLEPEYWWEPTSWSKEEGSRIREWVMAND